MYCLALVYAAMIWQITGAIALAAAFYAKTAHDAAPTITLDYSTFSGTRLANGVDQFIGMPYAAPPIGGLRFRAPQPPRKTKGTQKANKFGDYCIGTNETAGAGVSEDCLFVNVWRPSNATINSKLPVWVFIQGGGFNLNYSPNYNGSEVVEKSRHNVVLVNFNWRVGAYGFLAGKSVEKHGDLNAGLLDQIALMCWVRDNIAEFGGDPDHVVIHGSSAGAGSVALHLLNRDVAPLFVGAIMESTFMPAQPHKDELEWQYDRFVKDAGCMNDDTMECLRHKSTSDLQKANMASPFPGRTAAPVWYWTPCIDGKLIPDRPLRMYARGEFTRVPMMIGNNENGKTTIFNVPANRPEGAYFAANASTAEQVRAFMHDNYPRITATEISDITKYYPLPKPVAQHAQWFPSAEQAYGESTFTCPALAILHASDTPVWSYHMNVYDKQYIELGLGCPHGYEEGLIFGPANENTPGRYVPPASLSTYNAPLVPIVMSYWISFVQTLSPNTYKDAAAPLWEDWNGDSNLLVRLDDMRMESVPTPQASRCDFWNKMNRSLLDR